MLWCEKIKSKRKENCFGVGKKERVWDGVGVRVCVGLTVSSSTADVRTVQQEN